MGYRIHYRTLNQIEYSDGQFNHATELNNLLEEVAYEVNEIIYLHDEGSRSFIEEDTQIEIEKGTLKKMIKYLKEKEEDFSDEIKEILKSLEENDYKLTDVISFLEEALEKADTRNDFITFDWF